MKYYSQGKQLFIPFSSTCSLSEVLDKHNRWYILAELLPWDKIEQLYSVSLKNEKVGARNKSARLVIGAMIIKHKLSLSDEETIQTIQENPYMQYFLGLEMFTSEPVFDASLFTTIRKRIDFDIFNDMTMKLIEKSKGFKEESKPKEDARKDDDTNKEDDNKNFTDPDGNQHSGSIKIDATCCNAEVRYPTDLDLLDDIRENTSKILDELYTKSGIFYNSIDNVDSSY